MSKLKFYITLNILNIILLVFIWGCVLIAAILCFLDYRGGGPIIQFYIAAGIQIMHLAVKLLLPRILANFAKKHEQSLVNKFMQFLVDNPKQKFTILTIVLCYDLPYLLVYKQLWSNDYMVNLYLFFVTYVLIYLGGIFVFYIMLYHEAAKLKKNHILA